MSSQQKLRPFLHQIYIKLVEALIGIAFQKHVIFSEVDEILVGLLLCGIARMETFRYFLYLKHVDVVGKQTVEGIFKLVEIFLLVDIEMEDLPSGMYAGIGP